MQFKFKVSCILAGLIGMTTATAQPALFKDADLKLGMQLIAEKNCDSCHQRRVGGDGSAIYKPEGRINTPGFLRGMVEQCNTELNLGLFPQEVDAVAAVKDLMDGFTSRSPQQAFRSKMWASIVNVYLGLGAKRGYWRLLT